MGPGSALPCGSDRADPAPADRAACARPRRGRDRGALRPDPGARAQVPRLAPLSGACRSRHGTLGHPREGGGRERLRTPRRPAGDDAADVRLQHATRHRAHSGGGAARRASREPRLRRVQDPDRQGVRSRRGRVAGALGGGRVGGSRGARRRRRSPRRREQLLHPRPRDRGRADARGVRRPSLRGALPLLGARVDEAGHRG